MSNSQIIRRCYSEILSREPDELGFNYYLSLLDKKQINERQLEEIIRSSPEFLERHPEYIPQLIYLNESEENLSDLKIVAMYRIKNVERWIKYSLNQASEVCHEIVILDDGSTDNTVNICKTFPKVVDIHQQRDMPFDETRDKNILLKMALRRRPEFIMTLDGDEIIMPNMKKILYEDLMFLHPDASVFEFRHLEMKEKPNQFVINNPTTNYLLPFLFRVKDQLPDLIFSKTNYPGNAHCPHIPQNTVGLDKPARSRVKILHYGYYDDNLRLAKYNFYKKLDPHNKDFYGYEHLIHPQKFSIPMEYGYLPEGYYIENI